MAKTDTEIREEVANKNNKRDRLLLMTLQELERLRYAITRLGNVTQDNMDQVMNDYDPDGTK